jgi:hypothetical protein
VRDAAVATAAGDRPDRQPHLPIPGPVQRRSQHPREHQRIVEGVVRTGLGDTPVPRQGFEAQIVQAQIQTAGQFDGAHDGVDGQLDARLIGLGGQEAVVEAGVVRDQCAAAHQLGQIVGDVAEGRLILQHLDGETVDVRGPGRPRG